MNNSSKHIVCLGGGIGTVNLVRGLKEHSCRITVVVSMADDGGSSGRLRRLYDIHPPGDLISCMAALCSSDTQFEKLLTYRFPGDRYGNESSLSGHKLGNLMMVAARDIAGDFQSATDLLKKIFSVKGDIYPATKNLISISAETIDGQIVEGEESIDLGRYPGVKKLKRVFLTPESPVVNPSVVEALKSADVIIAGPGDLYTTILPVLIIPEIMEFLKTSKKRKIFVTNVANKPFETEGYTLSGFYNAIKDHLGVFPFDTLVANENFTNRIPAKYNYKFVPISDGDKGFFEDKNIEIKFSDLVDESFPLYHDNKKLANTIFSLL